MSEKEDKEKELKKLKEKLWSVSRKKWAGKPYASFHNPKFTLTDAQRKTDKRAEMWGIDFKDKNVLDLGCNTCATMLWALDNGARFAEGIDKDKKAIEAGVEILEYCGYGENFEFSVISGYTIEDVMKDFPSGLKKDVLLALAVTAWVKDSNEFYEWINKSNIQEVILEDNKLDFKPEKIPNYEWEFLGTSTDDIHEFNHERKVWKGKRK